MQIHQKIILYSGLYIYVSHSFRKQFIVCPVKQAKQTSIIMWCSTNNNTLTPFSFSDVANKSAKTKRKSFSNLDVLSSWPSKHHVSLLSWDQAPLLSMSLLFSLSITAALLPLALMLNCSCVIVSSGSPFPFSWVTDMTFRYTGWQLLSPRNWIISFLCQQSRG